MSGAALHVEPGVAIGPYRLGESWSRLAGRSKPKHSSGSTTEIDRFEVNNFSLWSEGPRDQLTLILVRAPESARLREGVGLGSSLAEAMECFGEPKEEGDLVMFRGLPNTSFVLADPGEEDPYSKNLTDAAIIKILVFRPNQDRGLVAAQGWADWHDSLERSDWGPLPAK